MNHFESSPQIQKREVEIEPVYVKKSVSGGILFFELGICEPFVYMKMYALEASRLPNVSKLDIAASGGKAGLSKEIGEVNSLVLSLQIQMLVT